MTELEIEALGKPEAWVEVFDERSRTALRFTDVMCGETHDIDAGLVSELRTHFDEAELAELILVAGQANLNNRAGNAAKQLLGP